MFSWGFDDFLAHPYFHSSKGFQEPWGGAEALVLLALLLLLALGKYVLLIPAGSKAGQVTKLESRLKWLGQSAILMSTSSRQLVQSPAHRTTLRTWGGGDYWQQALKHARVSAFPWLSYG